MKTAVNYVCTERAHLMCPNMHFGILAQISERFEAERLAESMNALQKAHPFLQSLIAEDGETGRWMYLPQEDLTVPVAVRGEAASWQRDYDDVSRRGWDVRKECLLQALVYPGENEFQILLIAHHLLCDGRGLLQLAEELAAHYGKGIEPPFVEERLIESLCDLPEHSDLPWVSKLVIGDANRKWSKERHSVSYEEYAEFERRYLRANAVKRDVCTVGSLDLEEIVAQCRQNGVSVNDYLIAKMMLEENTDKVLIAADIRDRVKCYRQGALGNYATAFSVVVRKRKTDVFSLAKRVSAEVLRIRRCPQKEMTVLACYLQMQPELLDAVAIASLGDFPSPAGAFIGKNLFGYAARSNISITNLGKIESDVLTGAVFIPPASPANRKTLGVLTVNGTMQICTATAE